MFRPSHVLGDVVLDVVDSSDRVRACFARQCVPGLLGYGAGAAAVPEELAHVRYKDSHGLGIGTGLDEVHEIEHAPCSHGILADGSVSEDAKILLAFAEVEDQAFCCWQVRGCQDWDVWVLRGRIQRQESSG